MASPAVAYLAALFTFFAALPFYKTLKIVLNKLPQLWIQNSGSDMGTLLRHAIKLSQSFPPFILSQL
eukprot:11784192-Karenia_brevis.AAC.1